MKLIILFIFQFSFYTLSAQKDETAVIKPIPHPAFNFYLNTILENKTSFNLSSGSIVFQNPATFMELNTVQHYPGIFCKLEHKIQLKSKLAPRFRLGSYNYTEWMEGKGEYYSRYWK
jgi:hypothetical protein